MLTEFLRSFTLPGLEKKYIVADDSLTEEGAAADSKKVGEELAKKVDKETGKALSTNDYTNAEKTKLAGIDDGAQINTIEGVKVDGTEVTPDAQKKVNLNVYDKAAIDAIVQAIYAEVAKKLNIDGYSELATVGNALGLVTDSVVEDKEPYNFRSLAHLPVGKFCYDTIVGGSIVWNQLVQNGNFATVSKWSAINGTYTVSGNVATFTSTMAGDVTKQFYQNVNTEIDHKHLIVADVNPSKETYVCLRFGSVSGSPYLSTAPANTWSTVAGIKSAVTSRTEINVYGLYRLEVGDTIKIKNVMVIDLTAAVTPTIADYIYSLEQTTAGAGVAYFRKYFPDEYYEYCEPHFEHVQTSAKVTVGFNQWDEEWELGSFNNNTGEPTSASTAIRSKNFIPVLPGTDYYSRNSDNSYMTRLFYDSDKHYITYQSTRPAVFTTPSNAAYMKFRTESGVYGDTYKNDICINLHGDRDGEYEPYKKRTYPLDSSLTLRGIPKLDSANRLYFNGDVYRHDGSGEERYGFIDLGTLNWIVYRAERCIYRAVLQNLKVPGNTEIPNIMTPKYKTVTGNDTWVSGDIATTSSSTDYIFVCDTNYTDVASFKTAMSGVYLLYELKTPEPFTAEPFQSPMVVDPLGTEEFVDYAVEQGERDVKIPCGHTSEYPEDLVDKLEVLPHATGTNGDYLITEIDGKLYLKPYTQTVGLTSVSETEAEL